MTTPRTFHFATALLSDGWQRDVRMRIDTDGSIVALEPGSARAPADGAFACVVPGMPNLHSHAHQRALAGLTERGGTDADSFWRWRELMYALVGRIGPRHLHAIAAQLYVEMLKAGYTSVAEFQYLHHDPRGAPYTNPAEMSLQALEAARVAGIGITLLPVLYRYAGFGAEEPGDAQRRFVNDSDGFAAIVAALAAATHDDPGAALGVAPHSLRAVSIELLESVLAARTGGAGPIHLHIAEQTGEVEQCLAFSGQRPVAYLLDHVNVGPRWCLIHATHMDADETARLAASGAVAGVCPTTEASLGDGVFDATAWRAAGGRLGIGSDSQISVSPVEELRWLEYAQRLRHRRRNVLADDGSTGRALYEWAARGGARACGRAIGTLAVGRRADFVALDTEHPLLVGRGGDAVLDSYIFSGNVPLVRDVVVGGRHVIQAGRHADEKTIAAGYRAALEDLTD